MHYQHTLGNEKSEKRTDFLPAQGLRVWVHTEENALVVERVLLLGPGAFLDLLACGTYDGLDLGAVDETSDVGVGDLSSGKTTRKFQLEVRKKKGNEDRTYR